MKIYINSKSEDLVSLSATMPLSEFENCFVYCNHCGELILKSEALELNGHYYCKRCTFECSECGEVHPVFNCFYCYDSDARYCRDCYNHETFVCDDCGRHFRYEDSLTYCGDNAYCDSCYDRHNSVIADYHDFKDYGDIRFKGNEKRAESVYMGFELEVDMMFTDFYRQYGDEDSESGAEDVTVDTTTEPSRMFNHERRLKILCEAFDNLEYRERSIVAEHLGFCENCWSTHYIAEENGKKVKHKFKEAAFIDLAGEHGIVPSSADRIYRGAIDKLRKALKDDK